MTSSDSNSLKWHKSLLLCSHKTRMYDGLGCIFKIIHWVDGRMLHFGRKCSQARRCWELWVIFFKELFKFDKQLFKGHLFLWLLLLFFLLPYCPTRWIERQIFFAENKDHGCLDTAVMKEKLMLMAFSYFFFLPSHGYSEAHYLKQDKTSLLAT